MNQATSDHGRRRAWRVPLAAASVAAVAQVACGGGISIGTGGAGVFAVVGGGNVFPYLTSGNVYRPDPTATASDGITASGSQLTVAEAQGMLDAHNSWRAAVGVPPLVWSANVAAYQQNWMNRLAGSACSLQHNSASPYGENLFAGTLGHYDTGSAVASWASEKSLYRGEAITSTNYRQFGHYTQMVWRNTRELGCAKASCGDTLLVGCGYAPPGNVVGERAY